LPGFVVVGLFFFLATWFSIGGEGGGDIGGGDGGG
jgi:hypothetical protein